MITVISKRHPSVVKRVVCKNCGAELEYTPADVTQKEVGDYTGGVDYYNQIICPECHKSVLV